MNETKLTYGADCPEFVELSAWMDGEGQATVGDHVSGCRACDQTVKFYRKVDQAIASAMAPSANLAERIKVACANERGTALLRFWPAARWRLAAAAALVVAASLATVHYVSGPATVAPAVATAAPAIPQGPIASPVPAPVADEETVAQSDDYVWDNDAEEWVPRGSVRSADLTMATAGVADSAAGERGVREMAAAVRHVWVVAEAQKTDRVIRDSLPPELATQLGALPAGRPVTLRMVLKDRELQGVVDKLSAAGFSLVSPELPQPGEARRILAVGKSVMYEAELVPPASPQ